MGNGNIPKVVFGYGHTNLGSFSGAGGLVELGKGPLSLILQASSVASNKFSYCLVPLGSEKTSPLYIRNAAVASGMAYTPYVANTANPTFYYVHVTEISVASKVVNYLGGAFTIDRSGGGGFIFDLGTTLTYLQTGAFTAVVNKFKAAIPYPSASGSSSTLEYCFSTAGVANPTYSTMVFHFDGANFSLSPNNIFAALDMQGTTCLAMAGNTRFSIFSNIQQQQSHLIVHDLVNSHIGFKSANCKAA